MAKPRANIGAKKPAATDKKGTRKLKSGRDKKPFKKVFKKTIKPTKSLATPTKSLATPTKDTETTTKVSGVKRKKFHGKDNPSKKAKLSAPPPLDRKGRREKRKSQNPHWALVGETKTLWERLRRHDLKGEEKKTVMEKLIGLLSGHMYELALKHDTARVVQSCLKNGTPSQRSVVFTELKDHIVYLSKLKYSKFIIKALFTYCSREERGHVISSLHGNVRKLIRHEVASEIVEVAYNDYANATQRAALIQEFYGPTFALFKDEYTNPPRPLTQILSENQEHKESILKHMKDSLLPLCNKNVTRHSIVHRAFLEYLLLCDHKDRAEIIEALREVVVHILHTREGSKVALNCLWHGTPKDRKAIIKSFKTFVRRIALEEHGHVVLLGVFDTVDDTVLVKKALLNEVIADLPEISDSLFGRHVILYLLSPRTNRHFSPQYIDLLTPGDGNAHSKKIMSVRWSELREGVAKSFATMAAERAALWSYSKPHAPLLLEIVHVLKGVADLCPLYEVLLRDMCLEFNEDHIVAHPCAHWVLRKLLEATNNEETTPSHSEFAEMLLQRVSADQLQQWVGTNRGAFVVCGLLASKVSGVKEQVMEALSPILPTLKGGQVKGQEALLNELDKLNT